MASAAPAADAFHPARATHVAHAWLRGPIYVELLSEAQRRGEHVDQLAAKIVAGVILLGCVDEIIADVQRLLDR